jgi:aspartyl-tRNA(Asn)/glutamyl-tRNA(Gln) amidotransferase subunit B
MATERTPFRIAGETGEWEVVMGLEVHAQVASRSKLFSGSSTAFGADPNTNVSLVDAAMPGMLPVLNRYCVEQAVRTGLGLNARINLASRFDRKNYFYPDLPQGYQISQYQHPIVGEGEVEVEAEEGYSFTVGIERLHLEQDAGKSIHDLDPAATFVDLNRSGVALMEIVSRPDIRSPAEAAAYVKKLRSILIALGTCDGDMEKGNLRADVNVSVRRPGGPLGTRCEIKNVNSFRFIQQAADYEARRQVAIVEAGGRIEQETRLYDPNTGETRSMRSKEDAHDYRYFPDPDLLPLQLDPDFVHRIRASLPELPDQKRARFEAQYGLKRYDAALLAGDADRAAYFEAVAAACDPRLAANWVTGELFARLNKDGVDILDSPVAAGQLAELVRLVADGRISGRTAKDVFEMMWAGEGGAAELVERKGLAQVSDSGAIEAIVDQVIAANPGQWAQLREKPKTMGWFVGQVMRASGGKANPQAVNDILARRLGEPA